jgi:hypothetical protein
VRTRLSPRQWCGMRTTMRSSGLREEFKRIKTQDRAAVGHGAAMCSGRHSPPDRSRSTTADACHKTHRSAG